MFLLASAVETCDRSTSSCFDAYGPAELGQTIGQLVAAGNALHRTLLDVLAAFDRHEGFRVDGASSPEAWLMGMFSIERATAASWIATARALRDLPAIAAAFGEGRLSFDQVRHLARFVTPAGDADWAVRATAHSAATLRQFAARAHAESAEHTEELERRRQFRWSTGPDGAWQCHGRLAPADGAIVQSAIERIVDHDPPDPATGTFAPYASRCADAVVALAAQHLAADPDPDRACVVLHVPHTVLAAGTGTGLVHETPVNAATARRLACDARLQIVLTNPDGLPVGVGRTQRTVPPWLHRQLRYRDHAACRFPGCGRRRGLHAHHLVFWKAGGRTDLENLILLCPTHHKLVHDHHWHIDGDPNATIEFVSPHGTRFTGRPPPLDPAVRRRLQRTFGSLDPITPRLAAVS